MLLYLSGRVKKLDFISITLILSAVFVSVVLIRTFSDSQISTLKTEVLLYSDALKNLRTKISKPRYQFATQYDRIDYHDYEFINAEANRKGYGEQGKPHFLVELDEIEANSRVFEEFGFAGIVSDQISVNRSLPDVRLPA
jgi:hypothetical protein